MRVRKIVVAALALLALGCSGGDATPNDPAGGAPVDMPGPNPGLDAPTGNLTEPEPNEADPDEQPGITTPEG